jgi:inner membrane protein
MIRDLIAERQARRDEALAGIALGWGQRQTLAGPYLVVPYGRTWTEITREVVDGSARERRTERSEVGIARLAAESVEWTVEAAASEKARGIYKARLYSARIRARGQLALAEPFAVAGKAGQFQWGVPRLVLGISDPRGLRKVSALSLGEASVDFLPGASDAALAAGIHAPLEALRPGAARTLAFEFSLELAGSEALAIAPLARDTVVALRADWPHPSFQGVFLPAHHDVAADGFSARWQVSRHAAQASERLAACEQAKPCPSLTTQALGVAFVEPAGLYQRLERASKYGFLFVGLTFAAFLLLELLLRLPIHPVQYSLVGIALAMFFLLLTALSEHLAFALAYAIGTFACTGLIAVYAAYVLASVRAGLGFGAALAALYGVLYLLLGAEDYALLGGSLLLFGLLAAVMIATRRVDWYRLAPATPQR